MAEVQFFLPRPTLDFNLQRLLMKITKILRDKEYQFETKPGLFSKEQIDAGSELLIETMEIHPTDVVLDIGCGYGAIGLVAANLAKDGKTFMVDTDIRAVKYAKINAELNKIKNVEIKPSDGFEEVSDIKFDLVVSNPPSHVPKETLLEFIQDAKKQLKKNGKLLFVTEKRIKPLIEREFKRVFGNYDVLAARAQYVVSVAHQLPLE